MEPVKNNHPFKVGDIIRVNKCGLTHVPAAAMVTGEVQEAYKGSVLVRLDEVVWNAGGLASRTWYSGNPNEQLELFTPITEEARASAVTTKEWRLQKRGLEELSEPSLTLPKLLLDEAKDILAERGGTYGAAEDSFASIAQAWNAYLDNKPKNSRIAPLDVAMMMTILKCIREAQNHKWDNLVDIAGYAQNAACIAKPSQREAMR